MPAGELVCTSGDVPAGEVRRFVVQGTAVAVARDSAGTLHALSDTCSHEDVSLAEGFVEGCALECIGHGSAFDLRTGRPNQLPATEPVAVYALTEQDGEVFVDTASVLN